MDFVAEKGLLANVDYVQDPEDISRSGVTATPALVVDGKLLSSGRIPRRKELERWLTPQPEVDRWWAKKKERPKDLKSL
jgi:predicted thioredoxin/glutaredoxin